MIAAILPILLVFAVAEEPMEGPKCPADDQFRFNMIEKKLNLDGEKPLDIVARFEASEGDAVFFRRAVVLNPPVKNEEIKPTTWLEPCRQGGENPDVTVSSFEKVAVGSMDLLLVKEEGVGSEDARFLSFASGTLKTELSFRHAGTDGQFAESHTSKRLTVKITGDGELNVNGAPVDLEQMSLKARCRVRELYIQVEYEWDRKTKSFREINQSCVMGAAID